MGVGYTAPTSVKHERIIMVDTVNGTVLARHCVLIVVSTCML